MIQMSITSPHAGAAGHFRNLVIRNDRSPANIVDLGGGPRNTRIAHGVAYYFHDYPAPGQVTKVVSPRNPEMLADGEYQAIKGFTGKDVRAAVVSGIGFPTLLEPVDDLPPATAIRSVVKAGDQLIVTGFSEDNGDVAAIRVNGQTAEVVSTTPGLVDWQARIPAPADGLVQASARDAAGNAEKTVHRLTAAR
jgi:hypothetical protein